jgi:hypothetical protein
VSATCLNATHVYVLTLRFMLPAITNLSVACLQVVCGFSPDTADTPCSTPGGSVGCRLLQSNHLGVAHVCKHTVVPQG